MKGQGPLTYYPYPYPQVPLPITLKGYSYPCYCLMQTLAIALALAALASPNEDFHFMFAQCFGHNIEEELDGRIASILVEIRKDGIFHLQNMPSPVP